MLSDQWHHDQHVKINEGVQVRTTHNPCLILRRRRMTTSCRQERLVDIDNSSWFVITRAKLFQNKCIRISQ